MTPRRPWPQHVAVAVFAVLLVIAFLARGSGLAQVEVLPDTVQPGQDLTVRLAQSSSEIVALTFYRGSHTYVIEGGSWVELTGSGGWVAIGTEPEGPATSYVVTLPRAVGPGTYQVCATDKKLHQICTDLTVTESSEQ